MARPLAVFTVILGLLAAATFPAGDARAGMLAPPGPNPTWTEMQKFEWYMGYLARAGQLCGTFTEANVLHRLARMSPYGNIGLGAVMGDGFGGTACSSINKDARSIAADADKIQEYLEATYNCRGEGCHSLHMRESWTDHVCAEALKAHLSRRAIALERLREVTFHSARMMTAVPDYQARVRFKNCEGSLYVDLRESCSVKKDFVRGDCDIAGVERY